jgi:hypothetical protein
MQDCQLVYLNTKIPISFILVALGLVYFIAMSSILWPFGTFYGHVYYITDILYIFLFWYIFPVFACCAKKNLATLHPGLSVAH